MLVYQVCWQASDHVPSGATIGPLNIGDGEGYASLMMSLVLLRVRHKCVGDRVRYNADLRRIYQIYV